MWRLTKKGGLNFADKNLSLVDEWGYSHIYKRLAMYEDGEENGTILRFPCKVGDKVYELFKYGKQSFIQETYIEKIVVTAKGLRLKLARNSFYETAISSLGKTVFLTREEAEKRLEGLKK